MIRTSDIDALLNQRLHNGGTVEEWCHQNDVDESVIHRLVAEYGLDLASASAAVEAFRLGHDVRQQAEPRGERIAGEPRYEVQFVVIDTADGRIVGSPARARGSVDGLAGTYNDIASQTADGHP